jgi:hypothetical protein
MPTYIKTGYWDKLSKAPKGYLNLDLITGGGGSVTSVTKTELDTLVLSNGLTPGAYYLISGVDTPLYGGTTIIIQAATTNTLALAGHGIFYNPKYLNSQLTPNNGYGIYNSYMFPTITNVAGGAFNNGDTVTADNGATATFVALNVLIFLTGDWSLATTIDDGTGVTADITGAVSPSYSIGQDVIWGGKHWTNTTGNVGTATNKYTLSADWTVVPFNDVDYNVVADAIHYDYEHDMIIRRKDKWNNDVDGNFQVFDEFASPNGFDFGNPIKDFQWGNGNDDWNTDDYNYIGVQSNYVKDSYLECINFIGSNLWFNTLSQQSYMYRNITDTNSDIEYNTLSIGAIYENTLNNSQIELNTLNQNSQISSNTLNQNSQINSNTLNNDNSYISSNTLISSTINNNILDYAYSQINSNTLTNFGSISSNTLSSGRISGNTLTEGAEISHNTLSNFSRNSVGAGIDTQIINNSLTNFSNIFGNTLRHSTFDFSSSGTLNAKYIKFIEANFADATFNISTATIIFAQTYSKQMFRNSAGTTRLGYYNASDVFTVVNVNA